MLTLFEAARWAPSTYNEQEWRFLYARRDTPAWALFFDLLVEGNRVWCQRAALLAVVLAHKVFERNGKPNPVHLQDCGHAVENLALQGTAMGLVVHAMQGFDFEKARVTLAVPDDRLTTLLWREAPLPGAAPAGDRLLAGVALALGLAIAGAGCSPSPRAISSGSGILVGDARSSADRSTRGRPSRHCDSLHARRAG